MKEENEIKRKVFYVGEVIQRNTAWFKNTEAIDAMEEADVVMFLNSSLYPNPAIWGREVVTNHGLSYIPDNEKDLNDIKNFIKARSLSKKIIGFGTGGILCAALSGADIAQYIMRNSPHPVILQGEKGINYSGFRANFSASLRMQQVPGRNIDFTPIIVAEHNSSHHIFSNNEDVSFVSGGDIEACYYYSTNALCFEQIPYSSSSTINLFNDIINSFLNNTLENDFSYIPDEDDFEEREEREWLEKVRQLNSLGLDNNWKYENGRLYDSQDRIINTSEAKELEKLGGERSLDRLPPSSSSSWLTTSLEDLELTPKGVTGYTSFNGYISGHSGLYNFLIPPPVKTQKISKIKKIKND